MAAAAVALFTVAGSADAAVLNGTFNVTAVNVTNVSRTESEATRANFDAALADTLGGANSVSTSDSFVYTGPLFLGTPAAQTIAGWLGTGGVGSSVSGLDAAFGGLTLSKGNIDAPNGGTATTTFFLFTPTFALGAGEFTVRHDDGVALFEDGARIGGFVGPNTARTTVVSGFGGGAFELLYVATNNNPSILEVDADLAPIPVPAPLALLASALMGFGFLGRRKKAA